MAAALYEASGLPDDQLLERPGPCRRRIGRGSLLRTWAIAATGATGPAAASNGSAYRFDILCDYGAFRDLQRHRMLTIQWQAIYA